jgi:hypothetical protein
MVKKQYNQSGGMPGAVVAVGKFVVVVVWSIGVALFDLFKNTFYISPKTHKMNGVLDYVDYNLYKWGSFWIFLKWCFKSAIYLVIFCYGGPIVILAGIMYLYSQLIQKMSVRNDELDMANNNKKNNSQTG